MAFVIPRWYAGGVHGDSIHLAHLLVPVLRVGDELAVLGVHHEVEILQRNLAEQVRHVLADVHHVEVPVAALDFQSHRLIDGAFFGAVGGLGKTSSTFSKPSARMTLGLR